jgi:predicted nucleic acid-binding Zn ribbon protein
MPYCNRCAEAINSDERYCEECKAFLDGNVCLSDIFSQLNTY